jgi:hypothetical protein
MCALGVRKLFARTPDQKTKNSKQPRNASHKDEHPFNGYWLRPGVILISCFSLQENDKPYLHIYLQKAKD